MQAKQLNNKQCTKWIQKTAHIHANIEECSVFTNSFRAPSTEDTKTPRKICLESNIKHMRVWYSRCYRRFTVVRSWTFVIVFTCFVVCGYILLMRSNVDFFRRFVCRESRRKNKLFECFLHSVFHTQQTAHLHKTRYFYRVFFVLFCSVVFIYIHTFFVLFRLFFVDEFVHWNSMRCSNVCALCISVCIIICFVFHFVNFNSHIQLQHCMKEFCELLGIEKERRRKATQKISIMLRQKSAK